MYSYLTFSIILALVGLTLVVAATGSRRKFTFWSAVFAAPTGLADIWFAPAYWRPDHVFGPHFSIEGMLFSFGNGAILAFLVWPLFAKALSRGELSDNLLRNAWRYTLIVLPGFLTFLLLWDQLFGPLPVMQASFAAFVVLAIWLAVRGRLNPAIGLAGALLFAMAYWAQTVLWSLFDRDLAAFWPEHSIYLAHPLPFTGLPGDELMWAAFYGLLWPHIIAATIGGPMIGRRAGLRFFG